MSTNLILQSILNYSFTNKSLTSNVKFSNNRIQSVGESLEYFIRDLFINDINLSKEEKTKKLAKVFSWQGSNNNPPDLILRDSYAIEIKKIKTKKSAIALNSSYPKDFLYSNDTLLKKDCANVDQGNWKKNIFYYIGEVNNDNCLSSLFIIDGKCFASNQATYTSIKDKIKRGILQIDGIQFEETNELGKVKNIDLYKVTDLRIRGMWNIQNPHKLIKRYIDNFEDDYNLCCVITKSKYQSADSKIIRNLEKVNNIKIDFKQIPSPNNLSNMMDIVLIRLV